jgi:hippurate hydrolase
VARNVDPLDAAVVSICTFQAGNADNVIPQTARLRGTARSLRPEVRELLGKRLHEVVEATGKVYGATAKLNLRRGYPVLRNHERETTFAASIAGEVAGAEHVNTDMPPVMGGEDFSYMLESRPGAFIFVGNGNTQGLHHQSYNFNDDTIPFGTSYWVRLVETAMAG